VIRLTLGTILRWTPTEVEYFEGRQLSWYSNSGTGWMIEKSGFDFWNGEELFSFPQTGSGSTRGTGSCFLYGKAAVE
jgi:hypothetical protein